MTGSGWMYAQSPLESETLEFKLPKKFIIKTNPNIYMAGCVRGPRDPRPTYVR